MIVRSVASLSLSVKSTAGVRVKYLSMTWAMMSAAPQAVWYGGRVNVSSGFMMANFGRMHSPPASRLRPPSSFVTTEPLLASLPAAGMVSTTPTGSIRVTGIFRVA